VIGIAIAVHKVLGRVLLESAYKECMYYKLTEKGYMWKKEKPMPLVFEDVELNADTD